MHIKGGQRLSLKKQNFLQGALILSFATIFVKAIGALFKIPLMNIIGGEGMGYYNTAYQIFNPLYTLATAGIPVAVSRMVSECVTLGRFRDVRKIFQVSMVCFLITGTAGSLVMLFGARFLTSSVVGNPGAVWAVAVLSPAVFFICMMSAYRGYYQGLRNMYPTAVSQMVEAVFKLLLGLGLTLVVTKLGTAEYEKTGTIFGIKIGLTENAATAASAIAPYTAAAAIAGVMLSTIAGTIYLMIRYNRKGDGISEEELFSSVEPQESKTIFRCLIAIALPVCFASLATNLTNLIDLVSLMNRLEYAIRLDSDTILTMYEGLLPEKLTLSGIPNYLYGVYTGMPVELFNLIPAIATTFGISALPTVTEMWTAHNRHRIKRSIDSVLRITALMAFPAGLGLSFLSKQILDLLYPKVPLEVEIAAPMLTVMGISVIFVSIVVTCNSVLQAIGKERIPLVLLLIGAVVKLGVNFTFIAIPSINIKAAPYGSLCCYGLLLILSIILINRHAGIHVDLWSVFLKPLFAGLVCALSAKGVWLLTQEGLGSRVATVLAICVAVLIYTATVLAIRGVPKNDIKMLPKGEKIAELLAKWHLLG